ncbi:6-hydroxy-D-nicotine oxidase [Paractinoplanes abujensis]|uniref:FAD/FMN-containing dehydrogenase n=1 Tax=Paractinoplanes abujensis TaxID=882441 RepID=A0A7W7CN58_9ACTN|nr:FAD-binding oxidoreductase [Actinoplanes abujensis]MBB4691354.1 FAD/FMN-containing dehydrogenase [Actinoplanes abujensis]GID17230.1 6-hydroxy-D-nicotine oxidase [Actinoplanes abujensis]
MSVADAKQALRALLEDRLITSEQDGFAAARQVWNPAVTTRPAMIARCADTRDVGGVVRIAGDHGLPLSVRAGGHDWAGRALRKGGIVLDLTPMRAVTIDGATKTASVQGGAIADDLIGAATPYGMVAATGVVGGVGLAGLTLAGGYGALIGRCGLAADNLLGAEVVLADGTTVVAGPEGDADLWWALRGGGGNFGVVTALRFRLHEVPSLLAGILMFPASEGRAVLNGYAEIVAEARDDLTVMTGFLPGPQGPLAFLCPFWSSSDLAAGDRVITRLRTLGHAVVDQVRPMPYGGALRMFDASMTPGAHYLLRSRSLAAVEPGAADVLVAAAREMGPYSTLIVNHFHGAASRVDPSATAFAQRRPHHPVEVIASWLPEDSPDRHRAWADGVETALTPLALPGGYPNLLGPHEDARARDSFGPNLERLLALKRRYDPDLLFSAIPALTDTNADNAIPSRTDTSVDK